MTSALSHARRGKVVVHNDIELWSDARLAFVASRPFNLSQTEFDLLLSLAERLSEPIDRETILDKVLQMRGAAAASAVPVYVHRLRRKLQEAGSKLTIQAVRGKGYILSERTPGVGHERMDVVLGAGDDPSGRN